MAEFAEFESDVQADYARASHSLARSKGLPLSPAAVPALVVASAPARLGVDKAVTHVAQQQAVQGPFVDAIAGAYVGDAGAVQDLSHGVVALFQPSLAPPA